MIKSIFTEKAPEPVGPYSQAVKAGDYLFLSGQLGINPQTGNIEDGIEKQTEQAIRNLIAIVETAGGTTENIVQITVYLQNIDEFPEMNRVYGKFFRNIRPARITVESPHLPKNARVEISAIAYIPGDKK